MLHMKGNLCYSVSVKETKNLNALMLAAAKVSIVLCGCTTLVVALERLGRFA